jgi:hypothetical protein
MSLVVIVFEKSLNNLNILRNSCIKEDTYEETYDAYYKFVFSVFISLN